MALRPAAGQALLPSPFPQRRPIGQPAPARAWTATGTERQVFLDNTGRRGRFVAAAGAVAAVLAVLWLAALITGAVGFSSLPALRGAGSLASKTPPAPHFATRGAHHRSLNVALNGVPARFASASQHAHVDVD